MPRAGSVYAKAQFNGHIAGSIIIVTAAVTPKGERRRYALIRAAAELLSEGGFDAVRHRAVARRADMPLASTTYYFSSLDDLLIQAVEFIGVQETTRLRARLLRLSRRRRGVEATADVVVDLLLGDCPAEEISEKLISRYERYIACARHPWLRDIQRQISEQRTAAVVEAIERCSRTVRRDRIKALMCAVDGAVVAALVDDGEKVRATATAALADVIDVLAPLK
jgi:DNA-binding transcriptional regulator YbjK